MILDKRNEFADAVSLNTGAAGTYLIGDQIDLGKADNLGDGDLPFLVITVDTGINAAGAGTIQFKLSSDDSASIATNGTATDILLTPAFVTSTTSGNSGGALAAGTVLYVGRLPVKPDAERYLGILQVTGSQAISAGKINAFLTMDPAAWKAYADAVN